LIPVAREINDAMPSHVIKMLRKGLKGLGKAIGASKILVLGYAYLENSDDTRNSPSAILIEDLECIGAEVRVHDPFVEGYQADLYKLANGCDAAVVMVKHQEYEKIDFKKMKALIKTALVIDGRNMFPEQQLKETGFTYRRIGSAAS
jgi:UDP-N-acetyl-D-mannosaminuronic acid dehydrogenase